MELDGRQAQLLCDLRVFDLLGLLEREALDALGHVRAGGDSTPAAKGLELDVGDDAVLVDANLQLHDIAAPDDAGDDGEHNSRRQHAGGTGDSRRGTDQARTDILVVLWERTDLFEGTEREEGGRTSGGELSDNPRVQAGRDIRS